MKSVNLLVMEMPTESQNDLEVNYNAYDKLCFHEHMYFLCNYI